MGIYLNPGNENFKSMSSAEIYVDKSMMIAVINDFMDKDNKYVCLSRPRRFGKTMAGDMLSAYYSKGCDSKELFRDRKISSAPGYIDKLNRYNVIKIDVNSEYQNVTDIKKLIKTLTGDIRNEMKEAFPEISFGEDDSVARCIQKVYAKTGETFVVIMDEYDVLVWEQVSRELFDEYLSFLNGLFKSATLRPAISLAYLTGILPIVRDKIQSKLNNFREYTILDSLELAQFVGFTDDEVRGLCNEYGVDYEECRRWYDGYTQRGIEIYNPESVVMCIREGFFDNYWGRTSSYEVISDRLQQNLEGTRDDVVRMLAGESVDVNVTRYMNTLDSFRTKSDIFTYLIHVGYLAYNREDKTCRIPNGELRQEWFNAIEAEEEYSVTNRIIQSSKELLKETLSGNETAVAEALNRSHIHVSGNRSYNNEDVLQSAIYLAYIYALNEYNCYRELTTGKGFADVVYVPVHPEKPALIIELKHNKTPESAIQQIREKRYFDSLAQYQGKLLFVGISYDEKTKSHECRIENF
ncbi:MAG: ATP-binding protein [Lachnospiraceae bacterium]|nr:ATP-binding protein [Lachnospiraceae bacterium]